MTTRTPTDLGPRTRRHAEIELLMLTPDPDARQHYTELALAIGGENGRTCEHCGNQYARTRDESGSHWRARKYCGRSCAGAAAWIKSSTTKREARIEDVEWLLGTDSPDNIATRLGYKDAANLVTVLKRWGRPDLAARLARDSELVAA